jgi:hypothetical protein
VNAPELRYLIYKFLSGLIGQGDVRWTSLDSPEPGRPVTLSVEVFDHYRPGANRQYRITVEELCCRRPAGSGSDCSGSLRDACTCMCHYSRRPVPVKEGQSC